MTGTLAGMSEPILRLATPADAPEIDGTVRLLPPEKASVTLKVGEFKRARVVAAEGHDLIAQPL
jgi:ribosomal protein S12 methylthiotransferase